MQLTIFHYLIFFPSVLFMVFVLYRQIKLTYVLNAADLEKISAILSKFLSNLKNKKRIWNGDDLFAYTFYGENKNDSFELIFKRDRDRNFLEVVIYNIKKKKKTNLEFIVLFKKGLDYQDFEKQISSHLS